MGGKVLGAVITDVDKAMRLAIKRVFSDAKHHLYSWHLPGNGKENVKVEGFGEHFAKMMNSLYNVDGFKKQWASTIAMFKLEDSE